MEGRGGSDFRWIERLEDGEEVVFGRDGLLYYWVLGYGENIRHEKSGDLDQGHA